MIRLIFILKLLMLLKINDFLSLIIFKLTKKSLLLNLFCRILFSTQIRLMLTIINIIK